MNPTPTNIENIQFEQPTPTLSIPDQKIDTGNRKATMESQQDQIIIMKRDIIEKQQKVIQEKQLLLLRTQLAMMKGKKYSQLQKQRVVLTALEDEILEKEQVLQEKIRESQMLSGIPIEFATESSPKGAKELSQIGSTVPGEGTHEDRSMYEDQLDILNKDTKAVEAELLRSQLGILKDMQDEVDQKIKLEKDKQTKEEEYKQKLLEVSLETDPESEKKKATNEKNDEKEWFGEPKKDTTESVDSSS